MAITVGATAFGPLLLAMGFERYNSYGPALSALLVLPAAVALASAFAPLPDEALRRTVAARVAEQATAQ